MSSDASEPALIGIDWGTSSLRAFLIDAGGEVLDSVSSARGIMAVPDSDYDTVLRDLLGRWDRAHELPVIASGMITSRNGWVETPYVSVPTDAKDLAQALVNHETVDGRRLSFVTGITTDHEGAPDVMRGEETQIVGAASLGMDDGTFVVPGTHSKWITVADGCIEDYATYMTGEIFAALKENTILGTLAVEGPFSETGFRRGVREGLTSGAKLLHKLFHVRTLPLFGKISGEMVLDYLSGLLIGAEIQAAKGEAQGLVVVIGRNDLADRYVLALSEAGIGSSRAPEDIAARGHFLIAKSAGLVS